MSNIHAQVVLPSKTLAPRDNVVNTFSFITDTVGAPSSQDLTNVKNVLVQFYTAATSTGNSVGQRMSRSLARTNNACLIKQYDVTNQLSGNPAGSPVRIDTFTLPAPVTANEEPLPNEVCTVVTFHGAYTGGEFGPGGIRPRARQRGRVYIGPLGVSCMSHSITEQPIANQGWWDTLVAASATLLADLATKWACWSRKNAAMYEVVGGYVDNEFDTQRRRGDRPGGGKELFGTG